MVMAVNNAALLGGQAVIDPSGWGDQFRDGQKLRQEYDARQQTKALNELMGIQDFNERIAKARTHKYAGALVPELQKYEEARQKAALDNLGASADIGKTYAETGKLGAESGKIGAETGEIGIKTQNATLDGLVKKYDQISAGALTQNPQYFAVMLGDFENNSLINPDQKGVLINMIMKDPQQAAAVMRGIAKGSIEGFKATAPAVEYTNLGDRVESQVYDPLAGTVTGMGGYTINQSPDNKADNQGRYEVAGLNNNSREAIADLQSRTSIYNNDNNINSRESIASDAQAVNWFKAQTGASIAQQNANTNAKKAAPVAGPNGQPVRKLNTTEQKKLFEIQEQQNADISVVQTLDKMMKLVDNSYSGVAASGRAKGLSNIGLGGERADNTVLYDNLATSQALAQLKATFGAAPTEGERKILMDIQASASKTPMQKKQIIAQAFRAVQARQAYREKLANGIRTGQYMIPTTSNQPVATQPKTQSSKGASIIGGILGGS